MGPRTSILKLLPSPLQLLRKTDGSIGPRPLSGLLATVATRNGIEGNVAVADTVSFTSTTVDSETVHGPEVQPTFAPAAPDVAKQASTRQPTHSPSVGPTTSAQSEKVLVRAASKGSTESRLSAAQQAEFLRAFPKPLGNQKSVISLPGEEFAWEYNKSKKTYECNVYDENTKQLLGVCNSEQKAILGPKPTPVLKRIAKPRVSVGAKPKYKQAGTYRQWGGARVKIPDINGQLYCKKAPSEAELLDHNKAMAGIKQKFGNSKSGTDAVVEKWASDRAAAIDGLDANKWEDC